MPNKKITKGSQTLQPTDLPAYYSQVLEEWTKLVKLEEGHKVKQLIITKTGTPEHLMEIEGMLVSLEMLSSQGHNSFVYLVKTYGYPNEAILKHFKTGEFPEQPNYTTEAKLEARLQKYAHVHGLAPAVFAFNEVAMISEKCKAIDFKIPKCYSYNNLNVDFILQQWFNENTEKILTFIKRMYQEIGMYNTDPNEGNYMLNQSEKLIQIDYGGNRFDKKKSFDTFAIANGFVKGKSNRMYLSCQKQLLLEDQPTYPPYFYWFNQKLVNGTNVRQYLKLLPSTDELKLMDESQWEELFFKLRTRRDENCNKIKALEENINPQGQTALFVQHIVRKF